jgi:hypothetical protein
MGKGLDYLELFYTELFTVITSKKSVQKANEGSLVLFFLFLVLAFELRAYTSSHSTSPFFVMGFFKIEYCELFLCWIFAGFKL